MSIIGAQHHKSFCHFVAETLLFYLNFQLQAYNGIDQHRVVLYSSLFFTPSYF